MNSLDLFQDWEAHQTMDGKLVGKLMVKTSVLEMGRVDARVVIDFPVDWFFKHTVEEDAKLGKFLRTSQDRERSRSNLLSR